MSDTNERAKKALEQMENSMERLATADAVVHAEIGRAVLALLAQAQTIELDTLIAQLQRQAGGNPQGVMRSRLAAAQTCLRDASSKKP